MNTTLESLIDSQNTLAEKIKNAVTNFKKDNAERKSRPDYWRAKFEEMNTFSNSWNFNHSIIKDYPGEKTLYLTLYREISNKLSDVLTTIKKNLADESLVVFGAQPASFNPLTPITDQSGGAAGQKTAMTGAFFSYVVEIKSILPSICVIHISDTSIQIQTQCCYFC